MTAGRLAAVVLVLFGGLAVVVGTGFTSSDVDLGYGTTWMVHEPTGRVLHVTGSSAEVDFALAGHGRPGDDLEVRVGDDGLYVLNRSAGIVRRVSLQTFARDVEREVRASEDTDLFVGGDAVYIVDGARGQILPVDPIDLERLGRVQGPTGSPVAVADRAGRLWIYDPSSGEVLRVEGAVETDRVEVGDPGDDVVLALDDRHQPSAFNLSSGTWFDLLGRRSSAMPEGADSDAQVPLQVATGLPSIASGGRWLAFDPATDGEVTAELPVGEAGERLGRPYVADGRVYVPNIAAQTLAVGMADEDEPLFAASIPAGGDFFGVHVVDRLAFAQTVDTERAWRITPEGGVRNIELENPPNAVVFNLRGEDVTEVDPPTQEELEEQEEEEANQSNTGVVVTVPTTICPDGQEIPTGTDCPPRTCPDGQVVANGGVCPDVECSDPPAVVANGEPCPDKQCPDPVATVPNGAACPDKQCFDPVATVPNGAACPDKQCPDPVATVPNGAACPPKECLDPVATVGNGETCPPKECLDPVATVGNGETCPPKYCPDGVSTIDNGASTDLCPPVDCGGGVTVPNGQTCTSEPAAGIGGPGGPSPSSRQPISLPSGDTLLLIGLFLALVLIVADRRPVRAVT